MTMRVAFDGKVYQFGPELWGDLNLPADHSWWARSVRWSCGRPGFDMRGLRWWSEDAPKAAMRADLVSQWLTAALAVNLPEGFVKITSV